MNSMLLNTASALLPALLGVSGKQHLSILTYHRVLPKFDPMRPLEPTLPDFEWQMELLSKYFTPLALPQAVRLMLEGKLPRRAVCVTFDDGYSDNEEIALPVLERFSIPATIFISTGFLNGGRMWNDTVTEALRCAKGRTLDLSSIGLDDYELSNDASRRCAAVSIVNEIKHWPQDKRTKIVEAIESWETVGQLPTDLMMTDEQVKTMSSSGMDIGVHTVTHPILATLNEEQVISEICDAKLYLESLLGTPVASFAYPNGKPGVDYKPAHRDIVKSAGFELAVSTQWGVSTVKSDVWQLPRFTPWDRTPLRFLVRLLLNLRLPR